MGAKYIESCKIGSASPSAAVWKYATAFDCAIWVVKSHMASEVTLPGARLVAIWALQFLIVAVSSKM